MKRLTTAIFLFISVFSPQFAHGEVASLYLSDVVGLTPSGDLAFDQPTTFVINTQYDGSAGEIFGGASALRLHSSDGAEWLVPTYKWDTTSHLYRAYNGGRITNAFSLNGMLADTICFGGFVILGAGAIGPFDDHTFIVSTEFTDSNSIHKTFCIDSCFWPPANDWGWASELQDVIKPGWGGGPFASNYTNGEGYCFTIINPQAELYISAVTGLDSSGNIPLDTTIEITINAQYTGYTEPILASTNGFRLSSPDGAHWESASGQWVVGSPLYQGYDGSKLVQYTSWDGMLADTVGFGGYAIFSPGASSPFAEPVYKITIDLQSPDNWGRTICIDSSYYHLGNNWVWSRISEGIYPDWNSEFGKYVPGYGYCFKIGPEFVCGDVTSDGLRTVADLVFLVSYLFNNGSAPDPVFRGNVNCTVAPTHSVTVSDVILLVQYLFNNGPAPCANCPS